MKKVWILEKFNTPEDLAKDIVVMEEYLQNSLKDSPKYVSTCDDLVAKAKKRLEEHPEGLWSGVEGKTIYDQFCIVAKAAIKRSPEANYRVVQAQINDDAQYWVGYTDGVVNEGVLKYLLATC